MMRSEGCGKVRTSRPLSFLQEST